MKTRYFPSFLSLCVVFTLLCGCGKKQAETTAKLQIVCGLPPVAGLAAAIGGQRVSVRSLLPEGRTPHDYTPRPTEIREAFRGKIFFSTGMLFEKNAAAALGKAMKISDVTCGITRRELDDDSEHHHHHHEPEHGEKHNHHEEAMDPHVWLSPSNASRIAGNILAELCELDPAHQTEYQANCAALQAKLAAAAKQMQTRLTPYRGRTFFVYHPSFGYFAAEAGLHQKSIEINGREATAKQLAEVIREAQEHQVRVIFVQPQFNPVSAKALADRLHGEVMPLDPLARDLSENLQKITDALVRGFEGK